MGFSIDLTNAARGADAAGAPVRVGLIGAGKFGSMYLAQVPTCPGVKVTVIADLDVTRARAACASVGWDDARTSATVFLEDGAQLAARDDVDVVIEATGHPAAGIHHARTAIANGKHVVMVNVEADVLAGAVLAREAESAGVVYSMAYGDQPALICELVDWAAACGFEVVCAGKGTKYLPAYHASTPDTVWEHYGLTADQAADAGMNAQMFNSFLDGTKSAIEMAAVANATGLAVPRDGLAFPPVGISRLQHELKPRSAGGVLEVPGCVEVISSLERDGREIADDLRWGVFVTIRGVSDYAQACFAQYGIQCDDSGAYAALYRPSHMIGMELNVSVLSAALKRVPTGATRGFVGDVASVAKADLKVGETLDGEGGRTVYGKALPARVSVDHDALPIGLAHGVTLNRDVSKGDVVRWADVTIAMDSEAVKTRKACEALV